MSKLRVIYKNGQVHVKCKLTKNETIREYELQVFQQKVIPGIMRPIVEGKKKLHYVISSGIPLNQYLKEGVTRYNFFSILAQTNEVFKKIENNRLEMNNLVLDLNNVFINTMTRELHYIYEPIHGKSIETSIFEYIYRLAYTTIFLSGEDVTFFQQMINYFYQMPLYSTQIMEDYILSICPEVYRQVPHEKKGHSGMIKDNELMKSAQPMEGTALLTQQKEVLQAYLLRLGNSTRIDINKSLFRIGKGREQVDYLVTNHVVSRLHAYIIWRNGAYFINDNNSTNGTFVNGRQIKRNQDYQIYNGDIIMLANEGFEFHINTF